MIMTAEKIVSRASVALPAPDEHHREDQRGLDDRDGDRQDERPHRLADAVGDDLGVVHGGEDGPDERRRAEEREEAPPPAAAAATRRAAATAGTSQAQRGMAGS